MTEPAGEKVARALRVTDEVYKIVSALQPDMTFPFGEGGLRSKTDEVFKKVSASQPDMTVPFGEGGLRSKTDEVFKKS